MKEVMMTVYIGIDWSEKKHDVVFLNEAGAILGQLTMAHTLDGLQNLEKTRQHLGVDRAECLIALETAHSLVIDFLWSQGYQQVYVIPPSVIKSCRGRYGSSEARSDQQDGRLIADVLRTDRTRLQPWHPDSLLTRQLRAKVSFLRYVSRSCVRWSNRLRAVLLRYYPVAVDLFSSVQTPIALHFIIAYPTPQAAAQLTFSQFETFALEHHYPRHQQRLPSRFAGLQYPYPQASSETIQVYQAEARRLAQILLQLVQTKKQALAELSALFAQHPDRAVFANLPGAGPLLAPALLAKFGDDRARFPTPTSVQALAGTCPVTDQSGKRKVIKFRRACDREFRWIVQQWALCSLKNSVWANAYWQQVRPRCDSDSHACRCLANRWLAIAWKLWQTGQAYDEAYHLKQRALRSKPRP
jgi:transposase